MAAACSALQSLFTDAFLSSLSTLPSLVYNGGSLCHAEECSRGIEEEVESCCTLGGGTAGTHQKDVDADDDSHQVHISIF
jgi:hypothetical protein